MMKNRIKNLDGLRFIAAVVVVITHFNVFKTYYGVPKTEWRFLNNTGQAAMTFFFVLSGYLITLLLIKEKQNRLDEKFCLNHYYKRRIGRIWPLYYSVVILAFILTYQTSFFAKLPQYLVKTDYEIARNRFTGYLLFLPNTTEYLYGHNFYLGQTWSLGVEEFFYLFYPIGLYFIPFRKLKSFFVILIVFFITCSLAIHLFKGKLEAWVFIFFDKYRIYAFALGGLVAWFTLKDRFKMPLLLQIFFKKAVAKSMVGLIGVMTLTGVTFNIATQQVYAIIYSIFIFTLSVSQISLYLLNTNLVIYLGRITYGMYLLHPIINVGLLQLVKLQPDAGKKEILLLNAATLLLTILAAILSFELLERHFLTNKGRL